MSYLDKRIYERKREFAANKKAKNADKVTAEQAEVLAELCAFRHKFHCNMDSIVQDHTQSFQRLIAINIQLNRASLPIISGVPTDTTDYIDIDDIWTLQEMGTMNNYEDEYHRIHNELSALHEKIEIYLNKIDEQFGTNYAPSGASRIF